MGCLGAGIWYFWNMIPSTTSKDIWLLRPEALARGRLLGAARRGWLGCMDVIRARDQRWQLQPLS